MHCIPNKFVTWTALLPLLVCGQLLAHDGPPFPILMDERAGEYTVSVWADPDIGEAEFFLVLESKLEDTLEHLPKVLMWTEPESGRLPRAEYEMTRNKSLRKLQFECRPYFDRGDFWKVGFVVETPQGGVHEMSTRVESTPPGWGAWDLLIYSFPFALLGAAWSIGMIRRRLRGGRRGLTPAAQGNQV